MQKRGGGRMMDQNGPDCLWLTQANAGQSTVQFSSACICVSYSEIPLWAEESRWLPVQRRGKPCKATKCVPLVALVVVGSFWSAAGTGVLTGGGS